MDDISNFQAKQTFDTLFILEEKFQTATDYTKGAEKKFQTTINFMKAVDPYG